MAEVPGWRYRPGRYRWKNTKEAVVGIQQRSKAALATGQFSLVQSISAADACVAVDLDGCKDRILQPFQSRQDGVRLAGTACACGV